MSSHGAVKDAATCTGSVKHAVLLVAGDRTLKDERLVFRKQSCFMFYFSETTPVISLK